MPTANLTISALAAVGTAGVVPVTVELTDGTGTPVVGFTSTGPVVLPSSTVTNSSGEVTLALEPNANITPTGTYYVVKVADRRFLIEKSASTQTLQSAVADIIEDLGMATALLRLNNLSDLDNAATARTNLGLGNSATRDVGTTAGTVTAGDDPRLSVAAGPAGGVLSGNYPNPTFAADMATQAELDAHTGDATDAHAGTAITNTPAGSIAATTVQAAINELDGDITAHVGDATDAHAGTAITNTPAGTISATTVQAAINELDGDVTAHVGDTTDAHAGTAITNTPTGNIAATTVQAAINELDTEKFAKAGDTFTGNVTFADAINVIVNTTTGTKFGTATTQKLAFWNATPIVQPANTTAVDTLLTNTGLRASGGTATFDTAITTTGTSVTIGTNPATTGGVRLPNNTSIVSRNAANDNNVTIARVGSTDIAIFGESAASIQFSASTVFVTTFAGVTNILQVRNAQAAAAGVGAGLSLHGTSGNQTMAQIQSVWDGAATTDSNLVFYLRSGNQANTAVLSFASTKDATFSGNVTMTDAKNLAVGSTTGTKIGTATTQKLAFWNATPITQPANTTAIDTTLVNLGLRASGGVSNFSTVVTDPGTYAEIYVADASASQTTNASAGTFDTVTGWTTNGDSNDATADAANDRLRATRAGMYAINFSGSFSGTGLESFEIRLYNQTTSTDYPKISTERTLGAGGDVGSCGASGFVRLAANDYIIMRVACNTGNSKSFVLRDANFSMYRVGD